MYSSTTNNQFSDQDVFKLVRFFSHRLELFLAPHLLKLDVLLDKRLVSTFAGLCQSIVRLRSRSTGLLLSELGGYLLSFDKAPAGTKRISNLLRSSKWEDKIIIDYLATQAQQYVGNLCEKQQEILLLWAAAARMRVCRRSRKALSQKGYVQSEAVKASA